MCLLPALPVLGQTSTQPASTTVTFLRCGAIFTGASDQLRQGGAIAVVGGKIHGILDAAPARTAAAEIVDLSHDTCLPGLIDAHTHVLLQGDITAADYDKQLLKESHAYRAIVGAQSAKKALMYGFTTIRDLETEGAGYADVDIRHAIEGGIVPGPRMRVATRALDVTGAYPKFVTEMTVSVILTCRREASPVGSTVGFENAM
jgi:imidazolonepropionase-like amidohydrolase